MYNFFASSAKQQELLSVQERIRALQQQINITQEKFRGQLQKNAQLSRQLQTLSADLYALKQRYHKKRDECEEKHKTIEHLKAEFQNQEKNHHNLLQKTQEAKEIYQKKEYELKSLDAQREKKREQIQPLQDEINRLNGIISSSKPEARYRIDGEYCINGVHNCTNHPPRTVLLNGEEIQQHERKVAEATINRNKLTAEKQKIEYELRDLDNQYISLRHIVNTVKETYIRYLEQLQKEEKIVADMQKRIKHEEALYSTLKQQEEELKNNVEKTQSEYEKLSKEQLFAEQNVKLMENEITRKKIELINLNERAEQLAREMANQNAAEQEAKNLEKLAREELAKESTTNTATSQYPHTSTPYTDETLEELARQELAEEQKASQAQGAKKSNNVRSPAAYTPAASVQAENSFSSSSNGFFQQAQEGINQIKETLSHTATTASGLWPHAGIMLAQTVFNGQQMQQLEQELGSNSSQQAQAVSSSNRYQPQAQADMYEAKTTASDTATTVGDLWPHAGIMLSRAAYQGHQMQQLERELGENPSKQTGNLLIDKAKMLFRN